MRIFYVYAYLRSTASSNGAIGTPYYIGKGNGRRAYQPHDNIPLPGDRANIVMLATKLTEADALQAEMLLIHQYGRLNKGTGALRNLSDGGTGSIGAVRSEEFRARVREFHTGRKWSPEFCAKVTRGLTGKKLSAEHRANLSRAHKNQLNSRDAMEKCWASNRGRPASEERKRRISEAHLARWARIREEKKRASI